MFHIGLLEVCSMPLVAQSLRDNSQGIQWNGYSSVHQRLWVMYLWVTPMSWRLRAGGLLSAGGSVMLRAVIYIIYIYICIHICLSGNLCAQIQHVNVHFMSVVAPKHRMCMLLHLLWVCFIIEWTSLITHVWGLMHLATLHQSSHNKSSQPVLHLSTVVATWLRGGHWAPLGTWETPGWHKNWQWVNSNYQS